MKSKIPLSLRVIQKIFPLVEKVSPWAAKLWVIRLFFRPPRYRMSARERNKIDSSQRLSFTHNEQEISLYKFGKGPTVVLLHGWAGRSMQLMTMIDPIVDSGYSVVAVDLPAHGYSEGKKTTLPACANLLLKVGEQYGPIEAIVAHSFGGLVTMFARTKGLKVNKQVFIGVPAVATEIPTEFMSYINGSPKSAGYINGYIKSKFGLEFKDFTMEKLAGQLQAVPTFLVHDHDDKEAREHHMKAIERAFPDAPFHKTKGLGHTRILRDKEVVKRVVEFIS